MKLSYALCHSAPARWLIRWMLPGIGMMLLCAGRTEGRSWDFLMQTWHDRDGLPESSALALAQTPDGYLWVGSPEGLLRFNGLDFMRADKFTDVTRLSGTVSFLQTDAAGRLWAGSEGRVAVFNHGIWRKIGGTNNFIRSVADDGSGRIFIGGLTGELYTVPADNLTNFTTATPPPGLKSGGVFCITDARDGGLWLANKGFIGRKTTNGWARTVPTENISRPLLATRAREGGLWVYIPRELWRVHANGTVEKFPAPELDQPRDMIEDRDGTIWVATITGGLIRFPPGGEVTALTTANGLTHSAVRCLLEDREGNIWVGGSLNGLIRLKQRQFVTITRSEGLPDNIVRTILETAPGEIMVGTFGGGLARIRNGKVEVEPPNRDIQEQYIWSLLRDHGGRLWIGTFNYGLFVQDSQGRKPFPLPHMYREAVGQMLEDSQGRIWFGSPGGLGLIESNRLVNCFTNSSIADFAITSIAEDTNAGAIWIGTYAHGVYKISSRDVSQITPLPGLPGNRVSSVTVDQDGYLWIGVFEHGLACYHNGTVSVIGPEQGLPSETVGSIINDGRGYFWLSTTHGILRVAASELHRVAQHGGHPANFNLFTVSDGLESEYCVEGYQPNACRDHSGRLWFGTDSGVVTVDPAHLRLNTNPPVVIVLQLDYINHSGKHISAPADNGKLVVPPGSRELQFHFDGLCFTAPEKMRFKYWLQGGNPTWVNIEHDRQLQFRELPPGHYTLHLAGANNDGVWAETRNPVELSVQPFVWQTLWFRTAAVLVLAGGGGFLVRRGTRQQFQRRIEQLQEQRRLEQERARHATVMENTSDLVVFADSAGRLLHMNAAGRKLTGLDDNGEVQALTLAQLQPPVAAEKVAREGIPAARKNGTWEAETVLLHREGRQIPVSLVLIVHKDADGNESFLSAIARDITSHKQAEAELQRREKYFRWLIEHASDSITVINSQAVITYQSSSGERIWGYPAGALLGRNLFDLVHPEDLPRAREAVNQALAQLDVPVSLTARLRHHSGAWRTIQTVGTSSQTEGGEKQIVLNSRDLTDHLKLEAQLRQAQKMEAVGQLAGGVAHDFNNILTSLRLQAELIAMNEQLPAEVREGMRQICADTNRAADLTRQLLLFSRRQVMQARVLDLNQVVMNLAKMLQRIIREDVRLQLNLHPTPLMTNADAGMLDQVLINLAVNSRDAMAKGGWLRIETSEITVGEHEARLNPDASPGRYVCVSVRDTGGGIPPEILPRIFEPFFTTKEAGKGTGLGLATVFGIVKQHQGWIKLDNRPGEGVTFHVNLPATTAKAAPKAAPRPKPRGGTETILLVEDEWAVRMSTRLMLERHGYKVLEAADGADALQLWEKHRSRVALLLSDLVMPGDLGGQELGRRLEAEQPALKVIFASGYSSDIAGKDFQLQPGEAFVQKPFVTDQLLETIRRCLDS